MIAFNWPDVPTTERSDAFIQGMLNRMATSYAKYGAVADAYPRKVNAVESLKIRLDMYAKTGNTEYLMDVANFAMIEFMHSRHAEAHFIAEDSAASPGRAWHTGHTGQDANTLAKEAQRTGGLYKRSGD